MDNKKIRALKAQYTRKARAAFGSKINRPLAQGSRTGLSKTIRDRFWSWVVKTNNYLAEMSGKLQRLENSLVLQGMSYSDYEVQLLLLEKELETSFGREARRWYQRASGSWAGAREWEAITDIVGIKITSLS